MRMRRSTRSVVLGAVVVVVLLFFLYPYLWILSGSFQSNTTIIKGQVSFIPKKPTLENYIPLFTSQYGIKFFYRYLMNSHYVGIPSALLSTVIAAISAYSLSRFRFPGREVFARLLLMVYVFPVTLMIIPIEGLMASLGLVNKKEALILIHMALSVPFGTWLLRSFFDAVPRDIEEAAAVDGCSRFRTFVSVVFPLAAPGAATVFIYSLVTSWGEYLFASILIQSDVQKTVPLGLAMYTTEQYIEWGQLLAGTTIAFVPLLMIFMPLSGYFIKGFLEGAVKL